MQQTIDIPAPSAGDNETVITALETAALFRSKGDGLEAMSWLRRAAESAGEFGDDERALALSRVVADLHDELDAAPERKAPEPQAVPYPPPPSARAPQAGSLPSARASRPPSSSPRASYPPRSSSRPTYTPSPPRLPVAMGARQAARVAVEISTTKPGVFELRLLADGEAPRIGCSEALLVMTAKPKPVTGSTAWTAVYVNRLPE